MRLLHTSDWHLGRSFHRVGLLDAQAAFVDHLVAVVRSERVDLVVVSGDVYDRALPPVEAVALADDAFRRLVGAGARVVVTSGNHDSAPRLGFGRSLLELAGLHLRTDPADVARPVLLEDDHGGVAVYGIPYLEPDLVGPRWQVVERSHAAVLDEAMRRIRGDLASRPAGTRSVVAAHAFVAGGRRSEHSERDISVGGVEQVPVASFDGIDYVALGHLHGRHTLRDGMRYSGSPLAFAFSEAGQVKGSWLVELAGPLGTPTAEFIEAPVPRPIRVVSALFDDLLHDARFGELEDAWLQVNLLDASRPREAMARLRERFPHLLVLTFPAVAGAGRVEASRHAARTDLEVVEAFFRDIAGRPIGDDEATLVQRAFEEVRMAEDVAS